MEHTFTEANFDADVLGSAVPVLVDFWAPWCGPCRMMSPLVEELAAEIEETTLKVGKCNVDENGAIAMKYGIMSIPSFIVFKNGQPLEPIVGSMEKDHLREEVMKRLK